MTATHVRIYTFMYVYVRARMHACFTDPDPCHHRWQAAVAATRVSTTAFDQSATGGLHGSAMELSCSRCQTNSTELFYWRAVAQRYRTECLFIERWILPQLCREIETLRAQNREFARLHSSLRAALRARMGRTGVGVGTPRSALQL